MLGRVVDRARRIAGVDRVVVATSSEASDDVIAEFVETEGVDCYRGDLNDVAARAVGACEAFGLDAFSRICGDRPFFDPTIDSQLIELFHAHHLDLATTTGKAKVPPGLTGEIVRTATLKQALPHLSSFDREHVTSRFYAMPGEFKVEAITPPGYLKPDTNVRLVVDDVADLERARSIASGLSPSAADMSAVIRLAEQWDTEQRKLIA